MCFGAQIPSRAHGQPFRCSISFCFTLASNSPTKAAESIEFNSLVKEKCEPLPAEAAAGWVPLASKGNSGCPAWRLLCGPRERCIY